MNIIEILHLPPDDRVKLEKGKESLLNEYGLSEWPENFQHLGLMIYNLKACNVMATTLIMSLLGDIILTTNQVRQDTDTIEPLVIMDNIIAKRVINAVIDNPHYEDVEITEYDPYEIKYVFTETIDSIVNDILSELGEISVSPKTEHAEILCQKVLIGKNKIMFKYQGF